MLRLDLASPWDYAFDLNALPLPLARAVYDLFRQLADRLYVGILPPEVREGYGLISELSDTQARLEAAGAAHDPARTLAWLRETGEDAFWGIADVAEAADLLVRLEQATAPDPPWMTPPAAVRPLPVRQGDRTFVLRAPWPALVLAVREQQFYVAALARNRRPTPNTPLYHAPLMNVGASGRVCTGNAELPPAVGLDALAGWEAVLTDTYFTHVNHPRTVHLEPPAAPATETAPPPPSTAPGAANTHPHLHFWRELARARAIRFPKTALAPMGTTLQQFFNRLAQAR